MSEITREAEAVDDKTFQLILNEPCGLVPESLGKPPSNVPFIMPKRVAAAPGRWSFGAATEEPVFPL